MYDRYQQFAGTRRNLKKEIQVATVSLQNNVDDSDANKPEKFDKLLTDALWNGIQNPRREGTMALVDHQTLVNQQSDHRPLPHRSYKLACSRIRN
ncbi:hypothetical protein BRADI_4g21782v3 [Brachypodium distachyon]|uniref:Uncharacterized protein n=1 Tax=Brachypodium distachyon TaxID=15368 RepID=A0A2K2CP86_BRADI|nr:hypothetical protein BRADI_4g21782v3 [Brachypodium distachyon]